MKVMIGGGSGIGFGSIVLWGLVGVAALAVLSAEDIKRYIRIRRM